MKKLNVQNPAEDSLSKVHDNNGSADHNIPIDVRSLVKRVNSLIAHVSDMDGADEAEKNSRETSMHIKNIKEIMVLNEHILQSQEKLFESQVYTQEEEQALAEELADLLLKNGGLS